MGSPPLMRGKETLTPPTIHAERITPAHAGKSLPDMPDIGRREDHPRSCGEKVPVLEGDIFIVGSPPLMRGKVSFISGHLAELRITPAHAGKRYTTKALFLDFLGSPPLMRGKAKIGKAIRQYFRITPAHAGKSFF